MSKSLIASKRLPSKAFKSPLQKTQLKANTGQNEPCEDAVQELEKKLQNINADIYELEKSGFKIEMLQTHIDKLHHYNELKDYGQMILGRIAVLEGVRTKDLYPCYNLQLDD
ncbi:DNA repair protein SWI5 homolog [Saccostrea echinata]|uniref:DNA repair protein SWI5 homolog n=1 Tax=Saccostrea echinata TaxID=191078 RepID=UPI002A80BE61|nr:DNA repair protein SWI5 homolog [Saccostrea echinata]